MVPRNNNQYINYVPWYVRPYDVRLVRLARVGSVVLPSRVQSFSDLLLRD